MPPRRPPPLPQGLFAPQGPLAPGSAPLPPSPSTIHPKFVVDAHAHSGEKELSADNLSIKGILKVDDIKPTILDLTVSAASQADKVKASVTATKGKILDVVIGSSQPLDEKEWETLEDIISILDGGWGESGDTTNPSSIGQGNGLAGTKIIISGLLPPPLTKPSSPLLNDEVYGLHLARLAALSLHSDVYLKLLPPVIDNTIAGAGQSWWSDIKELERVLRMYVSPAIETFGTHRIIFGSSPATSSDSVKYPINDPSEWYMVLRKVITELGERQDELTDVMGQNAVNVYGL